MSEEWKPYASRKDGESYGFVTNGEVYRCEACGDEFAKTQGLWMHHQKHTNPDKLRQIAQMGNKTQRVLPRDEESLPPELEAQVERAVESMVAERNEQVYHALETLAAAVGIPLGDKETLESLQSELTDAREYIARLESRLDERNEELSQLRTEHDDLQAKIAIIKEAAVL